MDDSTRMAVRRALKYLSPDKVLVWGRAMVDPNLTARQVASIARELPTRYVSAGNTDQRRTGRSISKSGQAIAAGQLSVPPECAAHIDRLIATRAKECGVTQKRFKLSLGWR